MKALFLFALILLLFGGALAQDGQTGLTKDSRRFVASKDPRPVTQAEAKACLTLVQKALSSVLHLSPKAGPKLPESSAVVTREQTLVELDRVFELCKPKFVIKPTRTNFDATRFALHDKSAIASANTLVAWGCVPPVAPVVTGPAKTLTPAEFGDTIGYFVVRIADLTHTPSTRFSPLLKGLGPD